MQLGILSLTTSIILEASALYTCDRKRYWQWERIWPESKIDDKDHLYVLKKVKMHMYGSYYRYQMGSSGTISMITNAISTSAEKDEDLKTPIAIFICKQRLLSIDGKNKS